jgi:hypothetical protein
MICDRSSWKDLSDSLYCERFNRVNFSTRKDVVKIPDHPNRYIHFQKFWLIQEFLRSCTALGCVFKSFYRFN